MEIKCVYCKNSNISFKDHYKFEIIDDIKYLGKMDIYECSNCKLAFSDPMPNQKFLEYFYSKIYRAKFRPHHYDRFYKNNSYLDEINLDYLSYLTVFIDFEKINSILDFGSGLGNLGYALKKKFNHLELFSWETDENCMDILKNRGYKIFDKLEKINRKFDLVTSLHVFEHLTNLNPIIKIKDLLNDNGYLFFEVPNNNFDTGYKNRIFDSPHLLFFNKDFTNKFFDDLKMKKLNLVYSSYSIDHDIDNQQKSYNTTKKSIISLIKNFIKQIEPYFSVRLRRKITASSKVFSDEKLKWYLHGSKNSRCLRGLFVKKK